MSNNQQSQRKAAEKTDKDLLADFDRMVGVLSHDDWPILGAYFEDALQVHQGQVDNAASWDDYIHNRALRDYLRDVLLQLPERVRAQRDAIEERINNPSVEADTNPLED